MCSLRLLSPQTSKAGQPAEGTKNEGFYALLMDLPLNIQHKTYGSIRKKQFGHYKKLLCRIRSHDISRVIFMMPSPWLERATEAIGRQKEDRKFSRARMHETASPRPT